MTDPDTAPEQILSREGGTVARNITSLRRCTAGLGYEVVYATFPFLWNDPDLLYPGTPPAGNRLPVAHHLACRVRIDNRWVLVDATWDLPLKRAGFPVNENWDGRADTLCAVKSLQSAVRTAFCRTATNEPYRNGCGQQLNPCDGEQDHRDADAHARHYRGKTGMRTAEEIERIRRFNREFDVCLQEIRERP